jgi:hypothetical protein
MSARSCAESPQGAAFVYDTDEIDECSRLAAETWWSRNFAACAVHRNRKNEYVRREAECVVVVASQVIAMEVKPMRTSGLANIREQLLAEQERTVQELESARLKVEELEGELEQVQQMLAAGGERRGKGKARKRKRSANCDEVSDAIAHVLQKKEVVTEEELRNLVKKRLADSGRSLAGWTHRLREALMSDRFVESAGSYRLVVEEPPGGKSEDRPAGTILPTIVACAPDSGA